MTGAASSAAGDPTRCGPVDRQLLRVHARSHPARRPDEDDPAVRYAGTARATQEGSRARQELLRAIRGLSRQRRAGRPRPPLFDEHSGERPRQAVVLFAIPLGVLTAYRAGTRTDRSVTTSSFALIALPNFVLGLLLSYIVGVKLKWLPVGDYHGGWLDPLFGAGRDTNIGEHIRDMVLPAITLAAGQIAIYMRLLRSDMVATLQENFILMAKSKGISNRRILWRHALRPSSLTLLTVAGLNVGTLIGGSIVVEVIFQIPGMGKQIFDALASREYVELQGFILVLATVFVLVNFLVDVLYLVLDPRIRRARAAA
ncbi:MAG: ABC transporter permease [Actinobacteria bacterium]|nr:MAG: ABC transporter permease [Actinomycetota bacterium]